MLEFVRVESLIQTMISDIARMGGGQAQQNYMIVAEVREEMLRERNVSEQHGAQVFTASRHMVAQFESQKHDEINREASEEVQLRESIFRGKVREGIDEIQN